MEGDPRAPVDTSDPTPDRRHVARSLGLLFFLQGSVVELWLYLTDPAGARIVPLVGLGVLAQALGLWLRGGGLDTGSAWAVRGVIFLGTLLVAFGSVLAGSPASGFAFFFLWAAPYAVYFGLRHAVLQTGLALAALVVTHRALAGDLSLRDSLGEMLLPAATILVVSGTVQQLARELGRADGDRLSSQRDRAEAEARRAASERERARREAAMARLGRLALLASDRALLLNETARVLTETLGVDYCAILELLPDGASLEPVAGIGLDELDLGDDQQRVAARVLDEEEPIIVWEWASERRLAAPSLRAAGIRSSAAAAIRGRSGAFGILAVHDTRVGTFSSEEGQWLQAVADLLASALDRERSEAVMRHQSLHDALTGLPNRALLFDRIEQAFARAERYQSAVAVLLLDVDQFKTINDSLGHQAGDDLLVEVSSRLNSVVRPSDTVARLGGDEFVVLVEVTSDAEAFEIADRIAEVFKPAIHVGSGEVFTSASIGIAVARNPTQPATMLREADAAMYRAKERGRGRSELFDEDMRRDAFERLRTESDLRRALDRREFHVLYQPIFDVRTLEPIAVEALVRWQHPTRGIVGPVEFIALAEETGLIAPLGRWVLEQAVAEVGEWRRSYPAVPLRLAVNVSGQQLARPEFLDEVRQALRRGDLPPELLGLEITESVLMKDASSPRSTLEALRRLGVKVLIDDFGTGYSSLARLRHFPVDVIKIDRSFVDGLGHENDDTAIVAAVVEIARSMDLQVIAEGVEVGTQLERLRELGCHAGQGYLFSGPIEGAAVEALLADAAPRTAVAGF
ncbi:MAG: putative bifunctional diguanylate cyclase/phosphodiesterase [Solirubrobacteraceae bacterium]